MKVVGISSWVDEWIDASEGRATATLHAPESISLSGKEGEAKSHLIKGELHIERFGWAVRISV